MGALGIPSWNRTNDLLLRREALYPAELWGQASLFYQIIDKIGSQAAVVKPACRQASWYTLWL